MSATKEYRRAFSLAVTGRQAVIIDVMRSLTIGSRPHCAETARGYTDAYRWLEMKAHAHRLERARNFRRVARNDNDLWRAIHRTKAIASLTAAAEHRRNIAAPPWIRQQSS